jgi:hypothetical protein
MLRPQLTGEFSLDAASSPRKVLHCLNSEIRIDADPSRILFSVRISTQGHGSPAPLALSLTGGNAHDITQAETLAAPA